MLHNALPYILQWKYLAIALFLASLAAVHFRGKVRHAFFRKQLVDHSALFAPYNVLAYWLSKVPTRPFIPREYFPELAPLRENWRVIRDEAMALYEGGHVTPGGPRTEEDAGFTTFFKRGWTRFHLKWYREPLPSAVALCPKTVAILEKIPSLRAATFAMMRPGGSLNPHRDPYAGVLRYHLGLCTPNDDRCRIVVDGEPYTWRDGEDVIFDETYVHWVKNETDAPRMILFADIIRPARFRLMTLLNNLMGTMVGRSMAVRNVHGEPLGWVNHVYFVLHYIEEGRRRLKHYSKPLYRLAKAALAVAVILLLFRL